MSAAKKLLGRAACTGALVALPSLLAAAEGGVRSLRDLSIEELMEVRVEKVSSASKYEQRVTRAPATVTVVTGEEIAGFGHRTLADVLATVRGLYTTNDGNYTYLGMRGFLRPGDYNIRSLVLVDGHRINDNVYDGAFLARDSGINLDLVERVEVIRGPSSSVYGSSAFFGIVNVVTKKDLEGTRVTAEGGTLGTQRGAIDFGTRLKGGLKLLLSATAYHSDGRDSIYYPEFDPARSAEPRAANGGHADGADGERAYTFYARAEYGGLVATASASRRLKTVPTASFGTVFNSPLERTRDDRAYLDLHYTRPLGADTDLRLRGAYDSYAYRGDYPYADPAAPTALAYFNKDETLGQWATLEAETTHRFAGRHTLVAGAEYRQNLHQDQVNFDDTAPPAPYVADHRSSAHYGVYVQGDFALAPSLTLSAGLRRDEYPEGFGGTTNPRAALIWQASRQTVLKALYGEAFRAPNVYERHYYPLTPATLGPETIRMGELVLEHYFRTGLRASVSAYRYHLSDLIEQAVDASDEYFFMNRASAHARGVELELDGRLDCGWTLRASYARQRTEDAQGRVLTGSPRDLAKLNLLTPGLFGRVTAGFEAQYQSAVATLAGGSAPSFVVCNLNLTAPRVFGRVDLSLGVYNLFGTRHAFPGAAEHLQDTLQQEGRTARLKAVYRF